MKDKIIVISSPTELLELLENPESAVRIMAGVLAEQAKEEDIKSIIRPELTEAEVQAKKKAWMDMSGKRS